jgi:type II secretory pathway pseudopilin PulG
MNDVKNMYTSNGTGLGRGWNVLRRGGRRAFTIVEVMVAASVMVLAITSSLIVMQSGMRALDTARYTTLAGQILQSQMEKLRLLSWTQLVDATNGPTTTANATFAPDLAEDATEQIKRFYVGSTTGVCSQTFEDAGSPYTTPSTTMKKITLTATWKGIDGRSHSLSYITFYGKNGISDFFWTTHATP